MYKLRQRVICFMKTKLHFWRDFIKVRLLRHTQESGIGEKLVKDCSENSDCFANILKSLFFFKEIKIRLVDYRIRLCFIQKWKSEILIGRKDLETIHFLKRWFNLYLNSCLYFSRCFLLITKHWLNYAEHEVMQ